MDGDKLKFLMKESKLSARKLDKKTGISFSTITRLLLDSIEFKQSYIEKLCLYFSVSADYLINRSDLGYYIFVDDSRIPITHDEAVGIQDYLEIKEVDIDNADGLPNKCIKRTLTDSQFVEKLQMIKKIKALVDTMQYSEVKDTLDLIEKYILK